MKVLAITNLFGYPWDPSRGMFNQQQFKHLARHVDLAVLVAVPWVEAIRHPTTYWSGRRESRKRIPQVDYFIFWYLPGMAQALHSIFFFLSLTVQRPSTVFFKRWDALIGSWGFPDAVAAAAVGGITRTPVLMKVHGTDVNDYLSTPGKRWQILAAIRRCRTVMTPSYALRDRLIDAGVDADTVNVVYNGVDSVMFRPAERSAAQARLGFPTHEKLLLFVGNLKIAKGCVDLVDAFVAIAGAHPHLKLVVIGAGNARSFMAQRLAEYGLMNRVHFLGKLEHASLPDWFAAAQLFCLPSHNEGVPNVLLEAMACGLPIVASRVGGIPEVVPNFAGLLVTPGDTQELANALLNALARDWDIDRIAAHARKFTWEANIDRVLQLLGEAEYRKAESGLRP